MCGVPEAKIGHSQLCFVIIHNVIIIITLNTVMLGVTMFHIMQFVMGVRMMEDTDNANSPILQTIATMIAAWNTFRWVQRAPSAPARVKMKNGKLDLGFLPAEIESKIQPSASLLQDSFGVRIRIRIRIQIL